MGITTSLRSALKRMFYPHVESIGFVIDKSDQPHSTTFRRQVGDCAQVFDIQWDKSGKPRFTVNFAETTGAPIDIYGKPVPINEIRTYHCPTRLRLQRRRGGSMGCWFQLRRPLLNQLVAFKREYTPEEVAQQLLDCFLEIEHWWQSKERGPHVS
jgi:hypothetical protein